jgi:DNA polymerase-3 subunit gamma/tau
VQPPSAPPATPRGVGGIDTAAIRRAWPDVLAKLFSMKRTSWTFVSEHAQVLDYDGSRLTLGIATVGLANTFRRGQHAELVRQALIDVLGVDARVEGIPVPDPSATAPSGAPHPSVAPGAAPEPPSEPADGPYPDDRDAAGPPEATSSPRGTGSEPTSRAGRGDTGGPGGSGGYGGGSGGDSALGGDTGGAAGDRPSRSTAPIPGYGEGGWASSPAAPGTAPSWASDAVVHAGGPSTTASPAASSPAAASPAASSPAASSPAAASRAASSPAAASPAASSPSGATGSPLARARAAVAAEEPERTPGKHVADDSAASADDEDIETLDEVGRPVIERLLGGRVIDEGP